MAAIGACGQQLHLAAVCISAQVQLAPRGRAQAEEAQRLLALGGDARVGVYVFECAVTVSGVVVLGAGSALCTGTSSTCVAPGQRTGAASPPR